MKSRRAGNSSYSAVEYEEYGDTGADNIEPIRLKQRAHALPVVTPVSNEGLCSNCEFVGKCLLPSAGRHVMYCEEYR